MSLNKKKKKNKVRRMVSLTPKQKNAVAQRLSQDISSLLSGFAGKTGLIVVGIDVINKINPIPEQIGKVNINTTVNVKYGAPIPAQTVTPFKPPLGG